MKKILIVFLAALLFSSGLLFAEDETQDVDEAQEVYKSDWETAASINYSRGEYGTSSLIEVYELDASITRFFEMGLLTLTIPFISQRGDSQVTRSRSGEFFRVRKTETSRETNSGIGDITLDGSYYVLTEANAAPLDFYLNGYVKFPTADEGKGLGTGEFDAGPGLSLGKRFLEDWRAFFDFYYIFIGDPSAIDLDDQTSFDVGVSYDFNEALTASIAYEESSALVESNEDPKDILLGLNFKASSEIRLFGSIAFGLSEGSPDQSITIGAALAF